MRDNNDRMKIIDATQDHVGVAKVEGILFEEGHQANQFLGAMLRTRTDIY